MGGGFKSDELVQSREGEGFNSWAGQVSFHGRGRFHFTGGRGSFQFMGVVGQELVKGAEVVGFGGAKPFVFMRPTDMFTYG